MEKKKDKKKLDLSGKTNVGLFLVLDGLVGIFQKLLIYEDFPSFWFTQHGQKK